MSAEKKMQTTNVSAINPLKAFTKDDLSIMQRPISAKGFSLWVRKLLQNWRQGTVACKGRSDVNFTNKKPWRQKGTGRARAGSARSPLWRKGGVIFGPQPRTRTLKISKNLKQGILNTLFHKYLDQERILLANWTPPSTTPKTNAAYDFLRQAELLDKKVVLFLPIDDVITYASFVNLPQVRILFFDEFNAFDLAYGDRWIVLKKDLDSFKEMVSKWI